MESDYLKIVREICARKSSITPEGGIRPDEASDERYWDSKSVRW
jgi:hypothetical protein